MKNVSNTKLINRNKKIGNYTTIASLVVLGGGMYITLSTQSTDGLTWALACMAIGFLLSQIGIFLGNRFGRSPRPDEMLSAALKGLDDKYTLYHYVTAVSHLLVGPAGIWVLMPYTQQGKITYDAQKLRWKQEQSLGAKLLGIFAQEGLGRPDQEVRAALDDFKKALTKEVALEGLPEPNVAMVFVNPKVVVDAPQAHYPTLALDKLKDFIRRYARENPTPLDPIRLLQQQLPTESIE